MTENENHHELPHTHTEKDLLEDPQHEQGIKLSTVIFGIFLLIPVIAVLVFAFSAAAPK